MLRDGRYNKVFVPCLIKISEDNNEIIENRKNIFNKAIAQNLQNC